MTTSTSILRVPCVKCGSFGHTPELRLCSLCRLEVEARLKAGETARQIGREGHNLAVEAHKLEKALAEKAARDEWVSMETPPRQWQWVSIRLWDGAVWNRAQWNGRSFIGVGIHGHQVSHWRPL